MRRVADLPPGPCHERQPEDRIAGVDLERSEASQHVARQQVVPGLAGSVDCQAVVGPCRANVAHVACSHAARPAASLSAAATVPDNGDLRVRARRRCAHLYMRGHATSQLAGRCSGLQPTLGARDSRQRRAVPSSHLGWSGHGTMPTRGCAKVLDVSPYPPSGH